LLAVGRAQLSLGNAGTALETFRKLLREQPGNPDAFAGIAACYQSMGRYDLEQANYEFALAYAPHDQVLLQALAISLQRQGQSAQAAEIYAEIKRASAAPHAAAIQPDIAPANVARLATVTVELPAAAPMAIKAAAVKPIVPIVAVAAPAKPVAVPVKATVLAPMINAILAPVPAKPIARPVAVNSSAVPVMLNALTPAKPATPPVAVRAAAVPPIVNVAAAPLPIASPLLVQAADLPAFVNSAAAPLPVRRAPAPLVVKAATLPVIMRAVGRPAPVRLAAYQSNVSTPAAAEAETPPAAATLPQRPAQLQPAEERPQRRQIVAQDALAPARGPYLERLSKGEVALVTTSQPIWRSRMAPQQLAAASVQWVPLNRAAGRPAIEILNAARSQGLAAHTREALVDRGWRKMKIGDAREIRQRSLVLYSPAHQVLAWRLAAQLGCKAAKVDGRKTVVVLLGRDAALRRRSTSRA